LLWLHIEVGYSLSGVLYS